MVLRKKILICCVLLSCAFLLGARKVLFARLVDSLSEINLTETQMATVNSQDSISVEEAEKMKTGQKIASETGHSVLQNAKQFHKDGASTMPTDSVNHSPSFYSPEHPASRFSPIPIPTGEPTAHHRNLYFDTLAKQMDEMQQEEEASSSNDISDHGEEQADIDSGDEEDVEVVEEDAQLEDVEEPKQPEAIEVE